MNAHATSNTRIYAVTDTNFVLDTHSVHDLSLAYDTLHGQIGPAALDDPAIVYRRARAREALLLAMHFNKVKATTFSFQSEPVTMLLRRVPPAPGGQSLEADFTTQYIYFVKDYVLPDWDPQMPTQPGTESGNAADRAYIDAAKQFVAPLITSEGYRQDGSLVDEGMRKRAKDEGVPVFTPREFWTGKIDETAEIDAFLKRFKEQAPAYTEAHHKKHGQDKISETLTWIFGAYRMILRGEVEGRTTPVRVSVKREHSALGRDEL